MLSKAKHTYYQDQQNISGARLSMAEPGGAQLGKGQRSIFYCRDQQNIIGAGLSEAKYCPAQHSTAKRSKAHFTAKTNRT